MYYVYDKETKQYKFPMSGNFNDRMIKEDQRALKEMSARGAAGYDVAGAATRYADEAHCSFGIVQQVGGVGLTDKFYEQEEQMLINAGVISA